MASWNHLLLELKSQIISSYIHDFLRQTATESNYCQLAACIDIDASEIVGLLNVELRETSHRLLPGILDLLDVCPEMETEMLWILGQLSQRYQACTFTAANIAVSDPGFSDRKAAILFESHLAGRLSIMLSMRKGGATKSLSG